MLFRSRYYYPTSKNTLWVYRLNTGVAVPRGSSKILPWEKYFFTGGSNSIRAWQPRRLGPGAYRQSTDAVLNNFIAEQPGDVLIETNLELRQKLFSFFEGALFIDAGNVYTLKQDDSRPGGNFEAKSFIPRMALGTGAGLRMNFSFLVIRFDLGIKTYDPSRNAGEKWVIKDFSFKRKRDGNQSSLLNIGIGYPF